jgi:hypothetical protein
VLRFVLVGGEVAAWAEHTRSAWEHRLDRLEAHLAADQHETEHP